MSTEQGGRMGDVGRGRGARAAGQGGAEPAVCPPGSACSWPGPLSRPQSVPSVLCKNRERLVLNTTLAEQDCRLHGRPQTGP